MAEENSEKTSNGLLERINAIIRKTMANRRTHQGPRPFFPPPGIPPLIRHLSNLEPAHLVHPALEVNITEPLDTASSAISSAGTISSVDAEAAAASTEPTSSISESLESLKPIRIVRKPAYPESDEPYQIYYNPLASPESPPPLRHAEKFGCNEAAPPSPKSPPSVNPRRLEKSRHNEAPSPSPESSPPVNLRRVEKSCCNETIPPSPKSPPQPYPRRLGRSHRMEAPPPPPPRQTPNLNRPIPYSYEDELVILADMEMLRNNAEDENQLNETIDLLQCMEFPQESPDDPPPPYSLDIEDTELSESEQEPKLEKKKECMVCKRFELLSHKKDEIHICWLQCSIYLSSHMYDICPWGTSDKPKPEFWLSLEYQNARQQFDAEVAKYLENLELKNLSTAVTLYIERFMQVLYQHTPLDHIYSEENCEKELKELQNEFLQLITTREDVLRYLLYHKEGFRHGPCFTFQTAIEWIKQATLEISDGLRQYEVMMENLHLGRLVWSNDKK